MTMLSDGPGTVPGDLLHALHGAERVLVAAHARPDGDAVGSCTAMAWILRALGKDVILYNENEFPEWLGFLSKPCPVVTDPSMLPFRPDLIVALDCGDAERLGAGIVPLLAKTPVVNIDHHRGNSGFGSAANWVRPDAAAAGQLVAEIAEALGTGLEASAAEAIYVAISCDTGNFSFGNTDASVLALAAKLASGGLEVARLREKMDNTWSEGKWRLRARLMSDMRLLEGGRLAAAVVPLGTVEECGAKKEDMEGFVEEMRRLRGTRVALLLREENECGSVKTKISLRSSGNDDVRSVAAAFGGGGHLNAAGASYAGRAEEALAALLPELRAIWA